MTATARGLRILVGLTLIAVAFAMTVRAHLGLGPWHVLQQGLSLRTGLSLGLAGVITNSALFLAAVVLRERPGLGTLAAVGLGSGLLDVVLPLVPTPAAMPARLAFLIVGIIVMSGGAALYISADLGAAPLDAVMTGIYRRVPWSLSRVRLSLELLGLALGLAAGGEVGIGCAVVGLGIGPGIQAWLRLLKAMPVKLVEREISGGPAAAEPVLPARSTSLV